MSTEPRRPPLHALAVLALRAARWIWVTTTPLLVAGVLCLARLALGCARGIGRLCWWHRSALVGLVMRGLWWGALVLFVQSVTNVLDTSQRIDADAAQLSFSIGLSMSAAVVALSQARRLRWAGIGLGTAHAAAFTVLASLAGA